MKAILVLEDGTVFEGEGIGVAGTTTGEVVFNTSMTGYQEILTDPSYAGQLVSLTYPLIGNYGINLDDDESARPQVAGFIVKEMSDTPSNYRASCSGDEYLRQNNITGIQGVDVRALVRKLRESGVMMGVITTDLTRDEAVHHLKALPPYDAGTYAREVSTKAAYGWNEAGRGTSPQTLPTTTKPRVVVLDYGTKYNILRELSDRGLEVVVLPCSATPEEILGYEPDGIMLSNGPGDPRSLQTEVQNLRNLQDDQPTLPMFGICLGHQIMGLAAGGETYKLKFGHRGANHPVKDLTTGKVHITTQNHGYAIQADSLPKNVEVTHLNLNDNTVEGLRYLDKPIFSVQYHPEASPGPKDNTHLFDRFAAMVKERKAA